MILFPRFLAHAHYNPKDIPAMTWSTMAVYQMFLAIKGQSLSRGIWTALAMGGAMATSLNCLLLLPIFFIGADIENWGQKSERIKYAVPVIFLMSLLVMWLAWPQMWTDPLFPMRTLMRFSKQVFWTVEGSIFYFGRFYNAFQLPWHYTIVNFLMATPLFTLTAASAGLAVFWSDRKKFPLEYSLLLAWMVLPILIRSFKGVARYDEMRHVFMAVPPLMIMAAVGVSNTGSDRSADSHVRCFVAQPAGRSSHIVRLVRSACATQLRRCRRGLSR
jgi:4-amino-4-deoxy-L-arabinose transferase-like glycosyltransferase